MQACILRLKPPSLFFHEAGPPFPKITEVICRVPSRWWLAGLVELDAVGTAGGSGAVALVDAWHGAQAYHYWLLAHRHLYAGNTDAAMRTALHLRKYASCLHPIMLVPSILRMYMSHADAAGTHTLLQTL